MGKGTNYFLKNNWFLGPLLSYGYILLEIWDTLQGFLCGYAINWIYIIGFVLLCFFYSPQSENRGSYQLIWNFP